MQVRDVSAVQLAVAVVKLVLVFATGRYSSQQPPHEQDRRLESSPHVKERRMVAHVPARQGIRQGSWQQPTQSQLTAEKSKHVSEVLRSPQVDARQPFEQLSIVVA